MQLSYFEQREIENETRIRELRNFINQIDEVRQAKDLCIYITGSYARREASRYSDLDLFFINLSPDGKEVPNITKTLIDAELVRLSRKMGFPDFSNDGEFLEIHHLANILDELGSRNDEYHNYFTARLLFLLESSYVYNSSHYEFALKEIVKRYYTDFHRHNEDFLPIFLTNGVVRFWKYLTINYEHSRNRNPPSEKNKAHLKNLKLKFSRKMTCFSFLAVVLAYDKILNVDDIIEIVRLTPIKRLMKLKALKPDVSDLVDQLLDLYRWFLEVNDREKDDLLVWIGDKKNRLFAFGQAKSFGKLYYELIVKSAKRELFMNLIL